MFAELDFLTPEECTRTKQIIHALKKHWVNRSSGLLPFFTLGAASYLDASQTNRQAYTQAAEIYNPILKTNFPLLYENLAECLSTVLNMPVSYAEEYGLPGFHIFLTHKMFENPMASVHFDLQYQSLEWDYDEVDREHPISFTAAIALPEEGSGMNYWEITSKEATGLSKSELESLKQTKEMHFFPYQLGKMVVHSGLMLHQIAPSKNLQLGDERITLQGHGMICNGIMRLYW